jgi:hypothetical protein
MGSLTMALALQPLACTTPRIRMELKAEDSQWSDSTHAHRYGVTASAACQWRERDSTGDRSPCPHTLRCTLTEAQEAAAIRQALWLPLDELWAIVREFLNHSVSRSRLAKRHDLNTRPMEGKDTAIVRKTFNDYAPDFIHVNIKYLPPMADETKRRYLFVATPEAIRRAYQSIYVTEHRHAAMPASCTAFDNADSAHRRVVGTGACLRRIVVQHTPEPTSETPTNDAIAGTGICPRGEMMNASSVRVNPEPAHAHDTLTWRILSQHRARADNPQYTGLQHGLILEEVQMPPRTLICKNREKINHSKRERAIFEADRELAWMLN